MNQKVDSQQVASAGKSIVTWLTVLQVVSLISAVAYLLLAFLPRNPALPPELPQNVNIVLSALQVVFAVIYFLVLQWTKGWMTNVRYWVTGENTPDERAVAREVRALRGWIVFGQWAPLAVMLIVAPLMWSALGQLDPQLLAPTGTGDVPVTPEQLRSFAQVGAVIGLLSFGLPSFVINFMVLGWVRRWMTGVSDAILHQEQRETRLPELAGTLGRWFTFFQGLLLVLIAFILITPLLPAPEGSNTLADRLSLLVGFLHLSLWVALFQWSKTFMAGVTARAAGDTVRGR